MLPVLWLSVSSSLSNWELQCQLQGAIVIDQWPDISDADIPWWYKPSEESNEV
ncbi:uncharacterized protein FPRO_03276 [Fusarium proliferatum ET1]|uniref:Uncharacterized protein n=1 Tax=Fusarium proliferatum (strain ET1) TaxID=1227346 RepID=A0A1L7V8J1_FUSPR|nr:uncharacterized protein FPRO_03276 [Fusarium proliferatum ET1]CZR36464.1 uncharacterized protein FPRO_03276 [Fusarium proliferatum ET1]